MKKMFILLIFLFVPFILHASDNISIKKEYSNSIWNQRFPDNFNKKYPSTPSFSLVSREIFKIIRAYNPPIDRFAHWLGAKLGCFVPAGKFVLKEGGGIDHRKKNVNILDKDFYEESTKKSSDFPLFSYKLEPKLYFGSKFGVKLIFRKSIWDYNFTLVNEYKDSRDDGHYLFSMLKMNFVF